MLGLLFHLQDLCITYPTGHVMQEISMDCQYVRLISYLYIGIPIHVSSPSLDCDDITSTNQDLPLHVERCSSVGRMPDSQSREPGFESPLLPFRSLGIFFHFTTPQSTQLYK